MTQKEIRTILDNTKVYVNGKSKDIQKKLFSFGYKWYVRNHTEVSDVDEPFLFIHKEGYITHANNMRTFTEHENREISADEILSLEITGPSYRPFKSQEECFEEMQKHNPFGWIKSKMGNIFNIIALYHDEIKLNECEYEYSELSENYMFMDGAPFGIKEE